MDPHSLLNAVILGVVEGLTEFLPVSSTGHLIIVSDLLGLNDEKSKVFDIVIQLGAILAVVWEYRARFAKAFSGLASDPVQQRFAANLFVAFLPAAIVGLAFQKAIKAHFFNPVSVALALIPGTSRSGATIMGGMLFGLSRQVATEFSFFLAVPILFAATGYELVKNRAMLNADDMASIAVGFVVSFLAALVAVKALIRYVAHHDFKAFAWYRIALGFAVLAYFRL